MRIQAVDLIRFIQAAADSLLVERGQASREASALMTGEAGDAGFGSRLGILLPLPGKRLIGGVAEHGKYLVEVLFHLLCVTRALRRLRQAAE